MLSVFHKLNSRSFPHLNQSEFLTKCFFPPKPKHRLEGSFLTSTTRNVAFDSVMWCKLHIRHHEQTDVWRTAVIPSWPWTSRLKGACVSCLLYSSFPMHHRLQTLTQTPSAINTNFVFWKTAENPQWKLQSGNSLLGSAPSVFSKHFKCFTVII